MTRPRSHSDGAKVEMGFLTRTPLFLCMIQSAEQSRAPFPSVLHQARPLGEPVKYHAAVLSPCEQGEAPSLEWRTEQSSDLAWTAVWDSNSVCY